MTFINFFPTLLSWWYSKGISYLFEFLTVFFVHTSDYFSPIDVLLNIFKPWKRNINQKGRGLNAIGEWLADNLVSRFVGFFMRFILLLIYGAFLVFYILFLIVSVLFWFLMPFWVIISLIFIFL